MKLWESVSSFSVCTQRFIWLSFWKTQKYPRHMISNLKINGKPQKLFFSFCLFPFFLSCVVLTGGKSLWTCVSVSPALVFSSLAWSTHPLASHEWLESEYHLTCTVRKATPDSWTWRNTWVLLTTSEFYLDNILSLQPEHSHPEELWSHMCAQKTDHK